MKHGDKAKAKAAKASKPSDKKSSAKAGSEKGGKALEATKTSREVKASTDKSGSKKAGAAEARSAPTAKAGGNGRGRAAGGDAVSFGNPVIAAAFKRAVKKYANSFRRLTD